MINQIYEQLKTPKTLEELYQGLNEIGLKWNKAQIELFVQVDKKILKSGNTYSIDIEKSDDVVLDIIDKTIGAKPMIPIRKVMDNIPEDIVIGADEILKIALESGKYQSPNRAVLKKVN